MLVRVCLAIDLVSGWHYQLTQYITSRKTNGKQFPETVPYLVDLLNTPYIYMYRWEALLGSFSSLPHAPAEGSI